jgi:hypothetical protein
MKNKVVKIPISSTQRWRNRFGKYGVPCMVSGRWLQFSETFSAFADEEAIWLNVMTIDSEDRPRKICELCVTREDLMKVLNSIQKK